MKRYLYAFLIFLMGSASFANQPEVKEQRDPESVVIIGSGVGALTSAIYLQRAGIDTLVIEGDNPGGAIAQSPTVHNWPGELEINGQDLVDKIRNQAEVNGARIVSKEVTHVDFSGDLLKITMRDVYDYEKIETIRAKSVILAMGSKPKLLGVPGESGDKGYWTKGVYSCAVCDGGLYKNKTVAVIGGGDAAIIEADYLSKIAKKVYVILRSGQFRTVETLRKNQLVKKSNVEVLYNTKVKQIEGNGKKVTHLNLTTSQDLEVDGVFVAIGANPNSEILKTQLELDDYGYVNLVKDQQTSVPNVFAIGDIVDPVYKQAISAAGDGAKAALQVEHYLATHVSEKTINDPTDAKIVQMANSTKDEVIQDIATREAFYSAIGEGSTPLVVDFYSPYCGPCKQLNSKLEQMAEKYSGKARFIKVNVTQLSELASNYNVFSLPTVMIFDSQGKMVEKASGLEKASATLEKLDKYTKK